MKAILRFLDEQCAKDGRYGGIHLDTFPKVTPAVGRHLRSRERLAEPEMEGRRRIRESARHHDRHQMFLRLLTAAYGGMRGYRTSWLPKGCSGAFDEEPSTPRGFLLERWAEEERIALQAAEESGRDYSWREELVGGEPVGTVLDGFGRPLWHGPILVHAEEGGYAVARHGPGRVLRDVAAKRAMLGLLDPARQEDRVFLDHLAHPYGGHPGPSGWTAAVSSRDDTAGAAPALTPVPCGRAEGNGGPDADAVPLTSPRPGSR